MTDEVTLMEWMGLSLGGIQKELEKVERRWGKLP